MEAVDYKRVAVVISGIPLPALRQDMMQRFADMFFQNEPRFDLITFAIECGCSTVEVPISFVNADDEIQDLGIVGKIRHSGELTTFRMKRQGSVQFGPGERVTLVCERKTDARLR
jgi:hypothetical protein